MKPDIRFLSQIKDVLYDKAWAAKAPHLEVYYMYRGLEKKDGLRYDITIIPARLLGREFVKTKGHEHKNCGELYIVLAGQAIYLMQKRRGNEIEDVFAVRAKKGDVVIIPSCYGHVTINPARKKLVMANWVAEKSQNTYDAISKKQGACYYYTKKGWIKNEKYRKVPKLRFQKPLKSIPKDLSFLK